MTELAEILKPNDGWELLARIIWGGILLAFIVAVILGLVVIAIEVSIIASIAILGFIFAAYLAGILIQWHVDNELWGRRIGGR